MAVATPLNAPARETTIIDGIRLDTLTFAPETTQLEDLHHVLADVELEAFGALKPTDSSCYGAIKPCVKTCC